MIYYTRACLCVSFTGLSSIKAAVLQRIVWTAASLALFVGAFAFGLKVLDRQLGFLEYIIPDTLVYSTFTSMVGFLLVFRASQSYNRFAEGATLMHIMQSDFIDTASLLITLSRYSTSSQACLLEFRRVVVRLLSCLNLLCLCELGGVEIPDLSVLSSQCIDLEGLDEGTLSVIEKSECKADVGCQLLQNVISDSLRGVLAEVPAPLLTRVYQELGGGMIRFHEALKLRNVPYPFPLMVVTELLLMAHCVYTPFQMCFANPGPYAAAAFSAGFTFCVWTLYGLAAELDDPFGTDVNDLDLTHLQEHLNYRLLSMLVTSVAPSSTLQETAADETELFYDLGSKQVVFEHEKSERVMVTTNHQVDDEPGTNSRRGDRFLIRPSSRSWTTDTLTKRVQQISIQPPEELSGESHWDNASSTVPTSRVMRRILNIEEPQVSGDITPPQNLQDITTCEEHRDEAVALSISRLCL